MIRSQQEELQRIVEALERAGFSALLVNRKEKYLVDDKDFQALKTMAYAERHPEVQPNRVTALTWQELEIAKTYTRLLPYSTEDEIRDLITDEMKRRLLNLLPNAKTE